ncbi:MAG: phosphodiester glycosidase family protein [Ruminococcaceae bacterium]|nr:phosphodiester glycosidase family protein [Oscillospiraceae bacterium]
MKKYLICITVIAALLGAMIPPVHAAVIHEVLEERELFGGVVYRHIQRLEDSGWQDIHAVQADLNAPGVKLEVLKSNKGESYMETVSKLAAESGAIAAVNADFFAAKRGESGRGSAVGVEVREGELKSSASVAESMNTLYKVLDDERFYVNAFRFDITVTAANGKMDKIKLVNKYDDLTGIVMYTDDWAETSVGSVGGIIEVSVDKNGTVVEKVTESAPVRIPDGGYVLSAHMSYNTFLLDYVQVGDKISVDIQSTPNVDYIETAVGGGAVLVHEGAIPATYSHNATGRNPRSAVGLDESGMIVTLVAVDGRRSEAKGMTQKELSRLMLDLGCYTALNFDGGGSTAMAIEQKVVNTPSDGSQRKVTNALGVVTQTEDNAPAIAAQIKCDDRVFLGAALPIRVIGLNQYRKETPLNGNVVLKADSGKIEGNLFYPDVVGTVKIKASCNGFTDEKEITVLNSPREISFENKKVSICSGETFTPVLTGYDAEGTKATIRLSDMSVASSNDVVKITDETITGTSEGSAVITASFGKVSANMAVMVDGAPEIGVPENISVPDSQNVAKELYAEGAYRFAVFGNTRNSVTLFDRFLLFLINLFNLFFKSCQKAPSPLTAISFVFI